MANNPSTLPGYNGQTAAPDANYPYGSARNDVSPGDLTGTPRIAAEINDIMGFQQALLGAAAVVPSGAPDTVQTSQYLEALDKRSSVTKATIAALKADLTLKVGTVVGVEEYSAGSGSGLLFGSIVAAATGTDDGGSFIDIDNGLQWKQNFIKGFVRVESFGALGDDSTDNTTAIDNASLYLVGASSLGGGTIKYGAGIFKATRIPHRSNVVHSGVAMTATALITTDSTTLDSNSSIGSFFYKPDDGNRVVRAGYNNLYIGSALSSVSTSQDVFLNVAGLNLVGCERTKMENLQFGGLGQGAIILARAEGGTEGLGMLATTQDGNYNTGSSIHIAACGKYNTDEAAVWFKYKANSNNFLAIYGKPVEVLLGIKHGNDNLINGCTAESSKSVATYGDKAYANTVIQPRAEGLASDAFLFNAGSQLNTVIGAWLTGVSGQEFNLSAAPRQTILASGTRYISGDVFPPVASVSTDHISDNTEVRAILGDNVTPFFVKPKTYNLGDYPVQQFWNPNVSPVSNDILFDLQGYNNDASGGAKGVSCSIKGVFEGGDGSTALTFSTGNGTSLAEKWRIDTAGNFHPAADNVYSVGEASNRASVIYAGTGAINTSDGNYKTDILDLNEAEKTTALELKNAIKRFRYKDAVSAKGENARYHFGVIAQEVAKAFTDNGLDAEDYGLFCSDTWYEKDQAWFERKEAVFVIYDNDEPIYVDKDTEGASEHVITVKYDEEVENSTERKQMVTSETMFEGATERSRLGIRYDELLAFIISAI